MTNMPKEKIALISGCSHSAGSEIDGTEDSHYNRDNAYGAVLAKKMGYRPLNISLNGATNSGIARSILSWFHEEYNPDTMDVFVIIGWTESTRMEVPAKKRACYYNEGNSASPWFDSSSNSFFRINFGWHGNTDDEKEMIPPYHQFMAENETILENWSATDVLMTQYYLKSLGIDYVMCDTMHMFAPNEHFTSYLVNKIDKTRYYNVGTDESQAFYWKYRHMGYTNDKAQYWHHSEEPHRLYAEELYNFIKDNNNVQVD